MSAQAAPRRPDSAELTQSEAMALGLARSLVGCFFLAALSGAVDEPASMALINDATPGGPIHVALNALVLTGALLMLVGIGLRATALTLLVFITISAARYYSTNWSGDALAGLWRHLILVGVLIMIAAIFPGPGLRLRKSNPEAPGVREAPILLLPKTMVVPPKGARRTALPDHFDMTEADDMANLFADLWDEPHEKPEEDRAAA